MRIDNQPPEHTVTIKVEGASTSLLSIVIPCYNEQEVLTETFSQLEKFCIQAEGVCIELIFVDDGSKDNTREMLLDYARRNKRVRVIGFARNFGHQTAVSAGIDAAAGDAVVLIDADLQDPPAVIHEMLKKWREGFDVVYGMRTERAGESAFKLATARGFYKVLNYFSDVPIPLDTGDFRLMSRAVVETLRAMPEQTRFVRGMVSWVGFRQCALPYKRAERFAGSTKYPLRKMISFAVDGVLSFSRKPLQFSIGLGMLVAASSLAALIYAYYVRLFTDANLVDGWTSLIVAILFIGGVQLICIGILGEYIGRIHHETQGRPLYVADEYVGFGDQGPTFSRSPVVRLRSSGE